MCANKMYLFYCLLSFLYFFRTDMFIHGEDITTNEVIPAEKLLRFVFIIFFTSLVPDFLLIIYW